MIYCLKDEYGDYDYYFEPAKIVIRWYPKGTGGTLRNYLQIGQKDWFNVAHQIPKIATLPKATSLKLHILIRAIWTTELIEELR